MISSANTISVMNISETKTIPSDMLNFADITLNKL